MKAPILQPPEPSRRHLRPLPTVQTVPSAIRPPSRRRTALLVALIAAICLLASGTAVYAWQHGQVMSREATLTRVLQANRAAEQQIATLRHRLGGLQRLADRLGAGVERALAPDFGRRRAWLRMTGPPVADGTYAAYIGAAGVRPARLVVDIARLRPGGRPRITNSNRLMRTIPMASKARVILWSWPAYGLPQSIAFHRFAGIINDPRRMQTPIVAGPFRITVVAGAITRVLQR